MIHPLTPPEVTPQVIAVKVPQRATGWRLSLGPNGIVNFYDHEDDMISQIAVGPGFEVIGNYGAATEEMAKRIVEQLGYNTGWYADYCSKAKNDTRFRFRSALESLHSLMNSKNLFLVNPYGEKEPEDIEHLGAFTQAQRQKWKQWQSAQDRTGDFILLIKK